MSARPGRRIPRGMGPFETANGLRIGGFVGALVGAGLTALVGPSAAWLVLAGAVLGATVGYLVQRRRLRRGR